MSDIVLTPDQTELLSKLEDFLTNNKLSFGLYGPAGSGKSFTISYFIQKNNLSDKIILTGTTNNACRVLEDSINILKTDTDNKIFEKINNILLEIENLKYKIETDTENCENIKILKYANDIKNLIIKNKLILEFNSKHYFKDDIINFIKENIIVFTDVPMLISILNNRLLHLFSNSSSVKTIHSLLCFEQIRDEKHNVLFLPSKSIVTEKTDINNKKIYNFTPKFTCEEKIYNKENPNIDADKNFYKRYLTGLKKFIKKDTDENNEQCGIIVIDESSMLKELEYSYILYICKLLHIKVIFLGDKYQLPPVDETQIVDENIQNTYETEKFIDFSPAVKIKNSYTLTTIKRTNNLVLQEVYKLYRDNVEKANKGKIKLHNIQFTGYVQPNDSYLIKSKNDINNMIDHIRRKNNNDIRILCFSNLEVEKMNKLMRTQLYGTDVEPYIKNEKLLVTGYMCLPNLNIEKILNIESLIQNPDRANFNYFFNRLLGFENEKKKEYEQVDKILRYTTLKLYTSCFIKILKIYDCQVYLKGKIINISLIVFDYEGNVSFFFNLKNKKDIEYIKKILKEEKDNIKINVDCFKMDNYCESDCRSMCKEHETCHDNCDECIKEHKRVYRTKIWKDYVIKEHLLNPSVNYSYATTVHKAQGQSIDNVIICEYNIANCILYRTDICETQKFLLYPTCMYTAITRSKDILVRLK